MYYRNNLLLTGKHSEVLLAFYIEILRKICQQSHCSFFDKQDVINFLLENESLIFENQKSSATLQQMAYNLLSEAEKLHILIPFKMSRFK